MSVSMGWVVRGAQCQFWGGPPSWGTPHAQRSYPAQPRAPGLGRGLRVPRGPPSPLPSQSIMSGLGGWERVFFRRLCRSRKGERGRRVAGPRDEGFLVTWRPFDEEEGRKNPHGAGWEVLRLAWARRPKMSQQPAGEGRCRRGMLFPFAGAGGAVQGCSVPPLFPFPGFPPGCGAAEEEKWFYSGGEQVLISAS